MRLLVVIASYGRGSDQYLAKLIQEYQSMSFTTDIVVCSNIIKPVPMGVELVVGMPTADPWSLPFAHKEIFAKRVGEYDLFIYSEDDTLATEHNIRSFLEVTGTLKVDEIAGFIRYEVLPDGCLRYCDVNGHYHWDPASVVTRGGQTYACFTNEHAAFYILTREQLEGAIRSNGFLTPPHHEKYDLACSAATDPYTRCGFRKLICISRLQDFRLHHLPNKYIGTRFGTHQDVFEKQIRALLTPDRCHDVQTVLCRTETALEDAWYSKDYYEPVRAEIVSEIPPVGASVLTVGCGSGELEKHLVSKGYRITAVCLDGVIAACLDGTPVEVVLSSEHDLERQLAGRSFDCAIVSDLVHLFSHPSRTITALCRHLAKHGRVIFTFPNLRKGKVLLRKLQGDPRFLAIGNHGQSGTHFVSTTKMRKWLDASGVRAQKIAYYRTGTPLNVWLRPVGRLLGSEVLVVGQKR